VVSKLDRLSRDVHFISGLMAHKVPFIIAPMLEKIDALPERLGQVETLLADSGYFSEANVVACVARQCRTADCGRAAAASSLRRTAGRADAPARRGSAFYDCSARQRVNLAVALDA
jgi:hypothetical protein